MGGMKTLESDDLSLEPLVAAHAAARFVLLSEPALFRFIDERPPQDAAQLRARYRKLESRASADGRQAWLNWIVRAKAGGPPLGFVQATVLDDGSAWVAYLLGSAHQGRGWATQATAAMLAHLETDHGVRTLLANVEAANAPSIRLLQRLGFRAATAEEAARHAPTPSERVFVRERRAGEDTCVAATPP